MSIELAKCKCCREVMDLQTWHVHGTPDSPCSAYPNGITPRPRKGESFEGFSARMEAIRKADKKERTSCLTR